jgi:hypothetical protein
MRAPRVRRSFLACFAFQGFSGLAFGSAVGRYVSLGLAKVWVAAMSITWSLTLLT